MRTEKQLGYIVFFSKNYQRGVYGVNLLIQSAVQCPEYCVKETDIFIKNILEKIDNLEDEEFLDIQKGLLSNYEQQPKSMWETLNTNVNLLSKNNLEFDIKQNKAEEAKKMKKEGVIQLIKTLFRDQARRLEIHYNRAEDVEKNDLMYAERKESSNQEEETLKRISGEDWIKENLSQRKSQTHYPLITTSLYFFIGNYSMFFISNA